MRLAIRTFLVYFRVLIVLLVVAAIGLILFKNRSYSVNVWLFGLTDANRPINVVWVMLATAGCTLVAWWLVSMGRGLVREVREVRRERVRVQAAGDDAGRLRTGCHGPLPSLSGDALTGPFFDQLIKS